MAMGDDSNNEMKEGINKKEGILGINILSIKI
jgi:hypothetical protein